MHIVRNITVTFISLFAASYLCAAPTISSVSGTIENGSKLLLQGKNFGTANAEPLVWDTVENHANNTSLLNQKEVTTTSQDVWSENGSAWSTPILFDTINKKPGRKISYAGQKKSYLKWPRAVKDKNLQNIYVSWWFWGSRDPNSGGANKFIRIWDDGNGKHTRISWTAHLIQATANDIGYNSGVKWGDWGGNNNQWNRLEIWVSDDTNTIKTWTNGKLLFHIDDFKKSSSSEGLNVYLLGFDPSISENYTDYKFNLADIYISPTIARVEISNRKSWNDLSANKEIQPIKSWKDDQIEFTLNTNSFSESDDKFLYVIDSSGNVNLTGYPVCIKCPEAPSLLIE